MGPLHGSGTDSGSVDVVWEGFKAETGASRVFVNDIAVSLLDVERGFDNFGGCSERKSLNSNPL